MCFRSSIARGVGPTSSRATSPTAARRSASRRRTAPSACSVPRPLSVPSRVCPILVVDEDLYEQPPAIVIGTVDKFARLPWSEHGGAFFGLGQLPPAVADHPGRDAPHLGPARNDRWALRGGDRRTSRACGGPSEGHRVHRDDPPGGRPGARRVRAIGRASSLPPAWTRTTRTSPGSRRIVPDAMYVGVMSPNHTPSSSLIHTAAALLQAPSNSELARRGPRRDVDARRLPQLAARAREGGHVCS